MNKDARAHGKGPIIEGEVEIGENVEIGNYTIIRGTDELPTKISDGTKICDFAIINPGVSILPNSIIGERTILGHPTKEMIVGINPSEVCPILKKFEMESPRTIIGEKAIIRSGTVIYLHTKIGNGLNTGHNAVIREHIALGDNCVVGGHTEMDGYTIVGNGTIISELIVTCQAMIVGNYVFLGGFLSFSENKKSIPGKISIGPTIEDYVRIGTGSSLMAETTIGKYSIVGAHSLVTRSIPEKVLAHGAPAKVIRNLTELEIGEYVKSMEGRVKALNA